MVGFDVVLHLTGEGDLDDVRVATFDENADAQAAQAAARRHRLSVLVHESVLLCRLPVLHALRKLIRSLKLRSYNDERSLTARHVPLLQSALNGWLPVRGWLSIDL
jgi:hypothetical protein